MSWMMMENRRVLKGKRSFVRHAIGNLKGGIMTKDNDLEQRFRLKPITKDERMQQLRVLKPETKERLRRMKKKGLFPHQSSSKRKQSST
jgi:tryptophan synthase alpha subunit